MDSAGTSANAEKAAEMEEVATDVLAAPHELVKHQDPCLWVSLSITER